MRIALTGATGFIGSHILSELRRRGHEVTALVHTEGNAAAAAERGAQPVVIDLFDPAAVAGALAGADAAVHTASPGDATGTALDTAVVDGVIEAFGDTGRAYLPISGLWVFGDNTAITESSPFHAPALVSAKEAVERRALQAKGVRTSVIVSSVAYGDGGGGVPGMLLGSPRDGSDRLIMLGDGTQHWSTVHAADLADVFGRVLEDESASGYYIVGDGTNPTVAELTEAAAAAVGAAGAAPGSEAEARARLGDLLADVLLLDQATEAARARDELGWRPLHGGLVQEFRSGGYGR